MCVSSPASFCVVERTQLRETELSYCKMKLVDPRLCTLLKKPLAQTLVDKLDTVLFFTFISKFNSFSSCFLSYLWSCERFTHCADDKNIHQIWPFSSKEDYRSMFLSSGFFFSLSVPRWIETLRHRIQIGLFCRSHPPDCSLICGERKRPFWELWWQSLSKNRSHRPLCNIYETALITDCFNPLLSASLWSPGRWKVNSTQSPRMLFQKL